MNDNNRIIVALDFDNRADAMTLLDKLSPQSCRVKVGKELFTRFGPDLVREVQQRGFEVFLDLKFHDIPNTVAKAVAAAAELGVWMLTLHASGGEAMMRAAREALADSDHKPLLVAVTVLTSMAEEDLMAQGISRATEEQVQRLAAIAQEGGMDGVVCSASEAASLRKLLSENFLLVTPGIRPAGDAADDQKRIVTPGDAVHAGSNYLVIGRPITRARHPDVKLQAILEEISGN
ncbi:orotidine-5'-phosphate decarboxylase [Pseudohongiella sp. SYSU M77423]|uniref:orotidine-5'-phosphate decarboxylase n=1 Tax=Pseudohongiella sp. SYSU M77423 TaxID=3042312 RepID=UPI00247FEB21|nr:orotidine-5'-phosphate decarboxylase [Pseudohongiella sp. SYSU M77423]MDH7943031.1 orotidine-5'-phosphate decarboxylase [Pseudohongiella sp. SYSU M77423]MEC8860166.1 orotidine-5'-phosphate decarboxylase [Pseudomonadota bacterium]